MMPLVFWPLYNWKGLYWCCHNDRAKSMSLTSQAIYQTNKNTDLRFSVRCTSVCYQRFCCIIEFAVIKKLDRVHSSSGR